MAAVRGRTRGHAALAIKAGASGVSHVWDWSARDTYALAPVVSITSQVCGAARFPGPYGSFRVLVIGTGGNACCWSDNEGTSWTAGADLATVPQDIVANPTHARFMVTSTGSAYVRYSADGAAAWAGAATGLSKGQGGIAVLANGDTVVAGRDGPVQYVAFAVSHDGGVTWTATSGALPDFGAYEPNESGWVCGQARAQVFHVGRAFGRTQLRVCSSADGVAWTVNKIFASPAGDIGLFFASNPRIFMCQETGLLVVTSTLDTGAAVAFASADLGVSWSGPMLYAFGGGIPAAAWGVANGKAFATLGTALFVSDGIARP